MPSRPVAVVTGASAGVGRATARALAQRGFDVALLARGEAGLAGAAADVRSEGVRALPLNVDVSEFEQVDRAASQVEAELGPIEVWVNDAMTTVFSPIDSVRPADFKRAVEVTFLGQVWGTMAALSRMKPRDRGRIVNVGSALAFIGIPLQAAYCASKFACRGFFESARSELLHEGSKVQMSMVHLPAVNTPQFDWCETTMPRHPQPVPPIYQPEVAAEFIVRTAIDGRPTKVVGSWNKLLVTAGRLFPALANQYAALAAWDSQMTDELPPERGGVNLYEPVDGRDDHGSHGDFDFKAGGALDPSFLRTVPMTAKTFAIASARTAAEKARRPLRALGHGGDDRSRAGGDGGPGDLRGSPFMTRLSAAVALVGRFQGPSATARPNRNTSAQPIVDVRQGRAPKADEVGRAGTTTAEAAKWSGQP